MNDRTTGVFSALGVLVVVWIVAYWSWPASGPSVSLTPVETEGELVVEPEPVPQPAPRPVSPRPAPVVIEPERETSPEPGGVIPPEFRPYTVQAGDNFDRISQRVYGTTRHGLAIARANPLLDPRRLRVGQVIRVPVDPSNIQGIPVGEPPPAPAETRVIEYTVKRGDTLSGIATSFYGSARYVDFLFDANRDRLRSRDDLRLGQVLRVPPLPDGAGGGRP